MEPLVLLCGWAWASVAMMLGYDFVALLAVLVCAATVATLRAYDEARRG